MPSLPSPPLLRSSTLRSRPKTRRTEQPPALSVVIVNYHQWGETANLVRQLAKARCISTGKAEVVVVDNHSPINPIFRWLRRRREVSLRRYRTNRGFARGVNEACRLSRGN